MRSVGHLDGLPENIRAEDELALRLHAASEQVIADPWMKTKAGESSMSGL